MVAEQEVPGDPEDVDPWEVFHHLVLRCKGLPEVSMQIGVIRQTLLEASSATGVFVLDHLMRQALTGEPASQAAWLAATLFLISAMDDPVIYPRIARWYEDASHSERQHVAHVLMELPPLKSVANPRALQQGRFERAISLGERRQLARGGNRRMLEQLLTDLSPLVVRRLLHNSRIDLTDVLGISTRRPNLPETLHEVAQNHRWITRYEVRLALVNNPYGRTGTALRLLALLRGPDLRRVALARDLHPALSRSAEGLLALRGTKNLT